MSHKRPQLTPPAGVQLGLIITPMLDMSFQILAFFIMTYSPSAFEGHIPGNLTPPEDFAKKSKDPVAAPSDPLSLPEDKLDPTLDEAITVRLKALVKGQFRTRTAGEPGQIFTRTKLDEADELLAGSDLSAVENENFGILSNMKDGKKREFWDMQFQKRVLPLLEARLKELGKGSKGKANIKIAGEGGLEYQYVLMIFDAAKRADFEKVHFVPPQIRSKIKSDRP